ncbi:hypothetical protein [Streptomyces sp. NPDC014995]|uniref:hypothetical protein n=1 Tax=Streptomyces sp. NPDC014995 TaxID=3364936 RepID=UPI0036F542A5
MVPKSKIELYAAKLGGYRAGLTKVAVMHKYGVGCATVQNALVQYQPGAQEELMTRLIIPAQECMA